MLTELSRRGFCVAPESARNIIRTRLAAGLSPRPDPVAFAHEILRADIETYQSIGATSSPAFFDRGILDALYMLSEQHAIAAGDLARYVRDFPYNRVVLLLPPWQAIYDTDSERDQTFEDAVDVYEGMKAWYLQWGYDVLDVPRSNVDERISFILNTITRR